MSRHRLRRRAVLALAAGSLAAVPAAASGAAASIAVSSPGHVSVGRTFTATVTGRGSTGDVVAVFLDRRACAATSGEEDTRGEAKRVLLSQVNGRFRGRLRIQPSRAGRVRICAYLSRGSGGELRATTSYVAALRPRFTG